MDPLRERVVVLTGATGGLGPYIARALAQRGAHLVLTALPDTNFEAVGSGLRELGAEVVACPGDVTNAADRERIIACALRGFGRLDILVNCAGVERMLEFEKLTPRDIERMVAVNLTAPMQLAQLAVPHLLARGWGRIISLASLAGKAAPPYAVPYAATKAGIIAFTRSLRAEYRARGVSASAIVPGFVRGAGMFHRMTQGTGQRAPRLLGTTTPGDVAWAVIRALDTDAAELIVNPGPMRLLSALNEIYPDLGAWIARRIAADALLLGWAAFNRGEPRRPEHGVTRDVEESWTETVS